MKIFQYCITAAAMLLMAGAAFTSCLRGAHMHSITVTPAEVFVVRGTTQQQFTAIANFSDGTTLDWTSAVLWEIAGPDTAGVEIGNDPGSYGLVRSSGTGTALMSTGTFTVTATDTINQMFDRATLAVVEFAVTPSLPAMPVNDQQQFEAIIGGIDQPMADQLRSSLTWTTSTPTVATIDNTGFLRSHATGTTSVTAAVPETNLASSVTLTVL